MNKAQRLERLARLLHESGRKAVNLGMVYATPARRKPFCEWRDLPPAAREGRRMMAAFLLDGRRASTMRHIFL